MHRLPNHSNRIWTRYCFVSYRHGKRLPEAHVARTAQDDTRSADLSRAIPGCVKMIPVRHWWLRQIFGMNAVHVWSHSSESIRTWHDVGAAENFRLNHFWVHRSDPVEHISSRTRHHGMCPAISSSSKCGPVASSEPACSSRIHRSWNRILPVRLSGSRCRSSAAWVDEFKWQRRNADSVSVFMGGVHFVLYLGQWIRASRAGNSVS